jgi:hypothetical protein
MNRLPNSLRTAASTLAKAIGFREVVLLGGAVLLGAGAWIVNPAAGLIVPGALFAYVAIFGVK